MHPGQVTVEGDQTSEIVGWAATPRRPGVATGFVACGPAHVSWWLRNALSLPVGRHVASRTGALPGV